MAWIGKSRGRFSLHDSDGNCGSFISVDDAAEILDVRTAALEPVPKHELDGVCVVSELDLHKLWGAGSISGPHAPRIGNASRSLDELILRKLIQLTLPGATVDCQVPFGRKRVDLAFVMEGRRYFVEFLGPSHFIPQYQRVPRPPFERKREIENHFGAECVLWPFWIQRCSQNIRAIVDVNAAGLASVWSTKALFGDFLSENAALEIIELSSRFNAIRSNGIGYMYGDSHTKKPVHPVLEDIRAGKADKRRLIPKGSDKPDSFWLPSFPD